MSSSDFCIGSAYVCPPPFGSKFAASLLAISQSPRLAAALVILGDSPVIVVSGILYRVRTGCQWRALPQVFGAPTTVHGWFQKISAAGIWQRLWARSLRLTYHPRADLLLDGSLIKAPLGGQLTGPSPVHRGRRGSKRSLLATASGLPVAVVLAPANRHDSRLVADTLNASLIPLSGSVIVCDRGYIGMNAARAAQLVGAKLVTPAGGSVIRRLQKQRWHVERTFAWINQWRGLAIRYDRKSENHLAMLHLWAYTVWLRQVG